MSMEPNSYSYMFNHSPYMNTWTTNTTTATTTTGWTQIYTTNAVYTAGDFYNTFVILYTDDIDGLTGFIEGSDDVKTEMFDILQDIYEEYESDQQFEDDLYEIVLDLIYEVVKKESAFTTESFFNEEKYTFKDLSTLIQSIINRFHRKFLTYAEEETQWV